MDIHKFNIILPLDSFYMSNIYEEKMTYVRN